MRTALILTDEVSRGLRRALEAEPFVERAAFVLCTEVRTPNSIKLLAVDVIAVSPDNYLTQTANRLSIASTAYAAVAKQARLANQSVIFAHSHPPGSLFFSAQDDLEEPKLIEFLQARIPERTHGAIVVSDGRMLGRLYIPEAQPVTLIAEFGPQWRLHAAAQSRDLSVFDRSIRALGTEGQKVLSCLSVGVIGAGGTGSAVAEALARLGVGTIRVFDDDVLEGTNLSRVIGSTAADVGRNKADINASHLRRIGLGTETLAIPGNIRNLETALEMRDCDIIFSCVDKELPRSILMAHHLQYATPIIDMGVKIEAHEGTMTEVWGRITTVAPGSPCLFCRGRISADGMRLETMGTVERNNQIRQGYAPELQQEAPAVVAYTLATAAHAVSELLSRLFMSTSKESLGAETLIRFDLGVVRGNTGARRLGCYCSNPALLACGDSKPHLGLAWA